MGKYYYDIQGVGYTAAIFKDEAFGDEMVDEATFPTEHEAWDWAEKRIEEMGDD
jgi:hypothetical protein